MTGTDNSNRRRKKKDISNRRQQLNRIFIRDNGICQLCFKPCDRADASRDHIIELQYCTPEQARNDNNVRLAHVTCNYERSNGIRPREVQEAFPYLEVQEAFPDFRFEPSKHLMYKPFANLRLDDG